MSAEDERGEQLLRGALGATLDAATVLVLVWAVWLNVQGNAPLWFYVARICRVTARRLGLWAIRAELAYREEIAP